MSAPTATSRFSPAFIEPASPRRTQVPAAGYHLSALGLILAVTCFRLWYLIYDTPLSLSSDEAHYWDWSRQLDWCYYSKGPLVAWLIRASCWLWGADTMPAVRFPAVLCGMLTMIGMYVLLYRVFRDARFCILAILAAQTLPFIHVGGLLMTIDAPYTCAWTWAVLVAHVILLPTGVGWVEEVQSQTKPITLWVVLGLVLALGVLAKHNMALFVPSLGLFLLLSRSHRHELVRPGFWLMAIMGAILGGGPILWWNSQHHWVTFLHVGTQAGVQTPTTLRWFGPLEFLALQAGLLLGFWFVLMILGMIQAGRSCLRTKASVPDRAMLNQLFLLSLSVPMLLIVTAFSFKVRIEPNWPITAYITGLVLAAGALRDRLYMPAWRRTTVGFCAAGLVLTVLIHHAEWLYPLHEKLMPTVSVRKWDATARLKGWPTLAKAVGELRDQQAKPPLLLGSNWSLTGALSFHLPDQPTVYCLGPITGSRHSQYDLWRPNPLYDPAQFAGQDAIIIGDITPQVRKGFERMEETRTIYATQAGLTVAQWHVTIGRGLKPDGFGEMSQVRH